MPNPFKLLLAVLLLSLALACAAPPPIIPFSFTLVEGKTTQDELAAIFGPTPLSVAKAENGNKIVTYSTFDKDQLKKVIVTYIRKNKTSVTHKLEWGHYYGGDYKAPKIIVEFNKKNVMEKATISSY